MASDKTTPNDLTPDWVEKVVTSALAAHGGNPEDMQLTALKVVQIKEMLRGALTEHLKPAQLRELAEQVAVIESLQP